MDIQLNNNISPSDDFYNYVNSNWIDKSDIPDDNNIWNVFKELYEDNYTKIHKLLTSSNNKYNKVYLLYTQLINTQRFNSPLEYIDNIINSNNIIELRQNIIKTFMCHNIISFNNFTPSADFTDSNNCILHIMPGGFGLPDKEYYTSESKKEIRDEYKKFIKNYSDYIKNKFKIDIDYAEIYKIEEHLAKYMYSNVQKRDTTLQNNPYYLNAIKVINKELYEDIVYFLNINNIPYDNYKINLINPNFTFKYYELLNTLNLDNIKQLYIYIFIRKIGNYISFDMEKMLFDFYSKTLSGIVEMKTLWKRAIDTLDGVIGMMVGMMYVDIYFSEEKKIMVEHMCKYIMNEFRNRIINNSWMEEKTKQKALDKLNKMNVKIGYPNKWIDYSELNISVNNNLLANIIECYKFDFKYDIKELFKAVDKTKWFMNPHSINAYYSPVINEIVFPAGILQSPFFGNIIACNFGGIGSIIGHEITHGFDDMGRKFDGDGNMIDWWTENDSIEYINRTNVLKNLYSSLEMEGEKINGELTLGENIADLGGVEISLNAYKKYCIDYNIKLDEKLFFYNYANVWKCKIRKEELLKRIAIDPHSPAYFRVNIVLSNIDDFYRVFSITNKSKMWIEPHKRAKIW